MSMTSPQTRVSVCAQIAALSLLFSSAAAQTGGTVAGVVVDAQSGAPLVAATVTLSNTVDTSAAVHGDLTDEKGAFSIERVPLGVSFRLDVSYLGYEKNEVATFTLTASESSRRFAAIQMKQTGIGLEQVHVQGARPDVRVTADKTVYAVENNAAYTATTVSELLGQIPSVQVDEDGTVSLRGDNNVTIMMDDRPLTMPGDQLKKFLQSLPSTMVKDIEIRTNPGAQFDAKNQGGIINIVTRRTMSDMFGGSVNAGGDSRGGLSGGGSFYFNGTRLTASLGGNMSINQGDGSSSGLRYNYLDASRYRDQSVGTSESESGSSHAYGQIDYKISASDLASLSFSLNHWGSDHRSFNERSFYNLGGELVARSSDTSAPGNGGGGSGGYRNASLLLRHTFSEDHKLSLDVGYNGHGYSGSTLFNTAYFGANGALDSLRSSARAMDFDETTHSIITTLDYTNPISDALTLSLGAKNEINRLNDRMDARDLDRRTGELVRDTVQSNHYLPDNFIYAGYVNAAIRPLEALTVQAGMRVESATVSAAYVTGEELISRTYTNFFPSASVGYNITPEHTLTASYRRSIALPDIDALNPRPVRWSELYTYSGNPDLEPEFTHTLELAYNTFWGVGNMISVSPYYSTTIGNIENSQTLTGGLTHSSTRNFNGSYSIGAEASLSLKPTSWLNFRIGGDVYQRVNRGSEIPGDIHSSAIGNSLNGTINIEPLEGMTISGSMFMRVPAMMGASKRSGWSYGSFSIRQRLFDKKLTLSLRVHDPFNMQKWEHRYSTPEFYTESSGRWTSRSIGLNISYMFGTTPRMEEHRQEKTETKGGGSGNSGGGGN